MKTRIVTTNPAGHIVSTYTGKLTPHEIANLYMEFYDDVYIFNDAKSIPQSWYIKCFNGKNPPELYQIKWNS